MSDMTATLSAQVSGQQATGRRFVWWLLLASVAPFPVFALLFGTSSVDPRAQATFTALFLMSVAHGGLSGLFWFDRRYRTYMAEWPRRYYWNVAALASVSLFGVFTFGQRFFEFFSLVYIVWNIFHFARQNWGVLCLTALGTNAAKPTRLENMAGHMACVGGAIGALPRDVTDMVYGMRQLGFAIVLLGFALSVTVAGRQIISRTDSLRIWMTLSIGAFFLPIYLLGPVGIGAIGAAHAAQYAVVMTVLARDRRQGRLLFRVAGMLFAASVYLALYTMLNDPRIGDGWLLPAKVASGLIVMWHYMIDAGLWRLREPFQRNAVKESFPFLFTQRPREFRGDLGSIAVPAE